MQELLKEWRLNQSIINDMDNELLLVVDADDKPLTPLRYQEVVTRRLWRRASGGAVIDSEKQRVLCQKRSALIPKPGMWTALFGGKSSPDETPLHTAQRELYEELGLHLADARFTFYEKFKVTERKQFEYVYLVNWNGNISQTKLDPKEVSEVVWMDMIEVIELLKHDSSWFSYGYDIEMLKTILLHPRDPKK